jgi:Uma2 family endonuclease
MTALATPPIPGLADAPAPERITPEQMLEMPEAKHAELVDGRLQEKTGMSGRSGYVTHIVHFLIEQYLRQHGLRAAVFDDQASYQCFPDKPDQVRKPDVSVILPERVVPAIWSRHIRIRPDLAVEVVSPNDSAMQLRGRVSDFLSAGTPLVWTIYPEQAVAVVYRPDDSVTQVRADSHLDGGDVLPGLSIAMAELLELPPSATQVED